MEGNERLSSHVRDRFYDLMINCKFNALYYQKYMQTPFNIDIGISVVCAVLSTAGVISIIEGTAPVSRTTALLVFAQVGAIMRPYLPCAKRVSAANFMSIEFQDLYRELESDWFLQLHSTYDIDDLDLERRLLSYQVCYDRIEERFGSNLTFPENKKAYQNAQEEMNVYFQTHVCNKGVERYVSE